MHCDNKGPTLTIIRSKKNHLYGGYTPLPWDRSNTNKAHMDMFIFTLSNPYNIPPTKYSIKQDPYCGIHCGASYGPIFGTDIVTYSNSHQRSSHTHFPTNYIDTTGKAQKTFTGNFDFTTMEIEVYSVSEGMQRGRHGEAGGEGKSRGEEKGYLG